jgi:hypothetical protein
MILHGGIFALGLLPLVSFRQLLLLTVVMMETMLITTMDQPCIAQLARLSLALVLLLTRFLELMLILLRVNLLAMLIRKLLLVVPRVILWL